MLALGALAAAGACDAVPLSPTVTVSSPPEVQRRDATTTAPSPTCFGIDESIDRLPDTIDNLAPVASAIVVARVEAIEPARWSTRDGRQPPSSWRPGTSLDAGIVTPARVTVTRRLAGDLSGELEVTTEGGTVGCVTHDVNPAPHLREGETYVLFLVPAAYADGDPWPGVMRVDVAWPLMGGTVRTALDGALSVGRLERLVAAAREERSPAAR